ncbi:translesion error-prone DNA polymerase V autoproteolytic subunit [Thiomicrospira sp.]|uniref:LexA family protein n=1 Tax=Thiomicrospira sp. TaxID=935 RepID=UPI002F9361B5
MKATEIYENEPATKVAIPMYSHKVVAGFPSPAEDYIDGMIDLNEQFIKSPTTSFLVRVQGESMKNAGIFDKDTLVVDRNLEPRDKDVVIAVVDGDLTVKRLSIKSTGTWLVPENEKFEPILIKEGSELFIWGVVTGVLRSLGR